MFGVSSSYSRRVHFSIFLLRFILGSILEREGPDLELGVGE